MDKHVSGKLIKYEKGKGTENIPRELLQDENLSYEAIGLLCQLQSYPSDWDLFKTELYKRNHKNKRTSVERIWDELVENGYIVQYRIRDGKAYCYQYLFSVNKFTEENLKEIGAVMSDAGYSFYLNDKQRDKINGTDNGEKWGVENQQSNENADATGFEKNGMLILNSSKPTPIIKRTIKDFDDDEDIIKLKAFAEVPELKMVLRLLVDSKVSLHDSVKIAEELSIDRSLLNPEMIVEQLKWCSYKAKHEGISDFAKYYINGLRTKIANSGVSPKNSGDEFITDFAVKILGGMAGLDMEVPMFNWLD